MGFGALDCFYAWGLRSFWDTLILTAAHRASKKVGRVAVKELKLSHYTGQNLLFTIYSARYVDRIWGIWDLIMIYPKPYSIYLRGTIYPLGYLNLSSLTAIRKRACVCWNPVS